MVELKKGEIYEAKFVRSGASASGAWRLIAVKDEKTHKEITVWADNPDTCGVEEGTNFRVDEILSIKLSARKDNKGEWRDTIACNAKVSAVGGMPAAFTNIGNDEELPF